VEILSLFKQKNGCLPKRMVVYRDGVSDSQFDAVLDADLPAIKDALQYLGHQPDVMQVAIVTCQKNHHTRLFFEANANGVDYINPCPGIVVDAGAGADSINSSVSKLP
jgi:hypothetical protein